MKMSKVLSAVILASCLALSVADAGTIYLRQSTASQTRAMGPFVDSTDGNTEKTALTIANTDTQCSKNGGAFASKNSGGGTYATRGMYLFTFDATDTNTVGPLQCVVHVSGALAVKQDFQVVEEAVYDRDFAASATGIVGSAQTGDAYARVGANGAGLSAIPWNPNWDAEVQSEANDALVALYLDRLFANTYDPASKPGAADALFNELVESDGGVSRFTANALEQGPSGGGALTQGDLGIHETTIAGLTDQTHWTLSGGSADDDAYRGWAAYLEDQSTSTQVALGCVSDYAGSTKGITLKADPGIFTIAVGDTVILQPAFCADGINVSSWNDVPLGTTNPLPNAAAGASNGLPTVDGNNAVKLQAGTGANQIDLSSGKVLLQPTQTGVTIPTVTALTNAPNDSSGITSLLSRLTSTRAGYLDLLNTYLDAAISSRLAAAGYTAPPSAASVRAEIDSNSTQLAALIARLTAARAGYLDNLSPGAVATGAALAATDSKVDNVPTNSELASALADLAAAGVYSLGYINAAGDHCELTISETTPNLTPVCTVP